MLNFVKFILFSSSFFMWVDIELAWGLFAVACLLVLTAVFIACCARLRGLHGEGVGEVVL